MTYIQVGLSALILMAQPSPPPPNKKKRRKKNNNKKKRSQLALQGTDRYQVAFEMCAWNIKEDVNVQKVEEKNTVFTFLLTQPLN